MQNILKRPMFRKGGLTQRSNYDVGGITSEDVLKQYEMLKGSLPQQKDDRMLRYISRAAGQIGNKPQPGTTALQRIINAASGNPLEQLFSETDERRKYDQGLQSLALEQAMAEKNRQRKLFDTGEARKADEEKELRIYEAKKKIDEQFGGADDNRTANQIDFEYVKEDLEARGMSPYNEDGSLSEDFKRSFYFYKTGKEITEEATQQFAMVNPTGDKRQIEAALANNQMQRIKQFHFDKARAANMDIATVDVYEPGTELDNYVLYIAEDGVMIPDPTSPEGERPLMITIPGSAYVLRKGDDVKIYDINFNEIQSE
mgnify:CR=1 FL=1|tara:strand:+ start:14354 stop:15298 length:945 start_codon:yes stop_codon:yes gene_type:complete